MFDHLRHLWLRARSLGSDESGEIPVGPLLVIGLIVIPLVIGLITFGTELQQWLRGQWDQVGSNTQPIDF
jgi:hypothetical protein